MNIETYAPTVEPVVEPVLMARLSEPEVVSTDWRRALPVLAGQTVTLRELRLADAPTLHALLKTEEVERFISPAPTTVAGFERFIRWTQRLREDGEYICYGVVPRGMEHAVGIFQVRRLVPSFETAEWGFALGRPFWGTGLFAESARLVVDFAFTEVGVHRLEARAALENGRGNGALAKLGAIRELVLRRSFLHHGAYLDQALWAMIKEDWMHAKAVWTATVL